MGSAATVAASVVTALLSAAVAIYVARASKAANAKTAEVQQDANALDGMDKLVHNLETRLDKVEAQNRQQGERIEQQEKRIKDLERERIRDRSMIRHLVTYARTLRDALHAAKLPVPEPPGGLDLDAGTT